MRCIRLTKNEIENLAIRYNWQDCKDKDVAWLYENGAIYKELSDTHYWKMIEPEDIKRLYGLMGLDTTSIKEEQLLNENSIKEKFGIGSKYYFSTSEHAFELTEIAKGKLELYMYEKHINNGNASLIYKDKFEFELNI